MVEIKAWYNPGQKEPIVLRSQVDVDVLLDHMVNDAIQYDVGVAAELSRRDAGDWAILQIGVRPDREFVAPPGSVVSLNGKPAGERVTYYYQNNESDVQVNTEVPFSSAGSPRIHAFWRQSSGERPLEKGRGLVLQP